MTVDAQMTNLQIGDLWSVRLRQSQKRKIEFIVEKWIHSFAFLIWSTWTFEVGYTQFIKRIIQAYICF